MLNRLDKTLMTTLVTVVTPSYNRAELLSETIKSVLAQDFQEYDYVVVDDGSNDHTEQVVRSYGERLQYRYQENQGEASAVNSGWSTAQTRYVAIVSSDDPVATNWLTAAIEFMESHPHILVGYPNWWMINQQAERTEEISVYEYSKERLYGWLHCLPGPGAVIRKDALPPGYLLRDASFKYVSDMESWMRLGCFGEFAKIDQRLASWRLHDNAATVTAEPEQRSRETIRLVYDFFARDDLGNDIRQHETSAKSRAHYLASVFLRHKKPILSGWHYVKSRLLQPIDPQNLPQELARKGPVDALLEKVSARFK